MHLTEPASHLGLLPFPNAGGNPLGAAFPLLLDQKQAGGGQPIAAAGAFVTDDLLQ